MALEQKDLEQRISKKFEEAKKLSQEEYNEKSIEAMNLLLAEAEALEKEGEILEVTKLLLAGADYFSEQGKSLETTILLRKIKEQDEYHEKYLKEIDPNTKIKTDYKEKILEELWRIKDKSYYNAIKNRLKEAKKRLYKAEFIEAKINLYDALGFAIELLLIPRKYRGGL